MEKTSYMRIVEIKRYAVLFLFLIVISIYYALTIPSNSIWHDQTLAVNLAKDVLNGNYPLVGYLHSSTISIYFRQSNIIILVCCSYEYIRSNDCNQVYLLKIWVSGICFIFAVFCHTRFHIVFFFFFLESKLYTIFHVNIYYFTFKIHK